MWYEAHLHAAGFNVEGFTLPGMPFVIVGHNQRIAWGYTNLNPDVQDLFIEKFNAAGEYQTPSGWQKPEVFHETIHVKGAPDVPFDVQCHPAWAHHYQPASRRDTCKSRCNG